MIQEHRQNLQRSATTITRPFFFVRHGQTEWNAENRLQGQIDAPLSEEGIRQAYAARDRLAAIRFDTIAYSPLQRTERTARIIAESQGCALVARPGLMERDFGELSGMRATDVVKAHSLTSRSEIHDLVPVGGESFEGMVDRFITELQTLLRDFEGRLLVVGHGGLCRSLRWLTEGTKRVCPNATPFEIVPVAGGMVFRELS